MIKVCRELRNLIRLFLYNYTGATKYVKYSNNYKGLSIVVHLADIINYLNSLNISLLRTEDNIFRNENNIETT